MKTDAYQKLFFPFHDLQKMRTKMEREPIWDDPEDHAEWQMMMYHSDQPEGVMMTALKEYAEPYDWVVDQLKDWAYMVSTTYVFCACPCRKGWKHMAALRPATSFCYGTNPRFGGTFIPYTSASI